MTSWSADELGELNRAGSPRLTAGSQPGWETELGMVTVDGQFYVRAYRGPSSRWFQAAQDAGTGKITAPGISWPVRDECRPRGLARHTAAARGPLAGARRSRDRRLARPGSGVAAAL
jgi:uncharacterized protein DUF2255